MSTITTLQETVVGTDNGALSPYNTISFRDIIILETSNNKKGDLFNRLVHDVFHSLGFGDAIYNVQQSGREIDMILKHRLENRYAIVESKAQKDKIGGSDINKFFGAFDIERGKYEQEGNSVAGYFVSQSGFTSTAVNQELERAHSRNNKDPIELILLGPNEIVRELVQGKVMCSLEEAVSTIDLPKEYELCLCKEVDLIASENGWIWVLYYSQHSGQVPTHFAFVHADGKQLHNYIAEKILEQSKKGRYSFTGLEYLIKNDDKKFLDKESARSYYFTYLSNELGEIQFEGLPTSKDTGSVKVNLESIYIPLLFNYENSVDPNLKKSKKSDMQRTSVSIQEVLTQSSRVAILAKPGGGKSTLIRRIALAYAYPERLKKVNDGLPEEDWFPVYIRCRDLGENAVKSVSEIIETIVYRAEMTTYAKEFTTIIEETLQNGNMLLLIDGLDEISQEKYRISFVTQLRTFVATYPNVHLIITSRETGFRSVAGTLNTYCQQYTIANLDEGQIRLLSQKWHQAILGESEVVNNDSEKVCDIIMGDSRITTLAVNPLLLTTLLFVKRCVGYLPTKKCRLYEEMIKLLLVTWNAVAHDKLDLDETEPQLAFVAYSMTVNGQQKITRYGLEQYINEARKTLPDLLGYTKISASRFIDQVEERSSLLIQLGLEEDDQGRLVESYEFSHLSFQEYLTARAITQSWIPDSTLLSVLKDHLADEHWFEVIPLAAVLLGIKAKQTIEYLVEIGEVDTPLDETTFTGSPKLMWHREDTAASLLGNCIASDVPMSQDMLERAFYIIVKRSKRLEKLSANSSEIERYRISSTNFVDAILNSRYSDMLKSFIRNNLFGDLDPRYLFEFSDAWITVNHFKDAGIELEEVEHLCASDDRKSHITGALLMMQYAFQYNYDAKKDIKIVMNRATELHIIFSSINRMLYDEDNLAYFAASWCVAWSGYENSDLIPTDLVPNIANRLVEIWSTTEMSIQIKRAVSWAIRSVCVPNLQLQMLDGLNECVEMNFVSPQNDMDRRAAINVAVLTGLWSKDVLRQKTKGFVSLEKTGKRKNLLREMNYID